MTTTSIPAAQSPVTGRGPRFSRWPRAVSAGPRWEQVLVPALACALSLLLFGVFVALAGVNPLDVYREMYRGAFGTWFSFQNSLVRAAPLMLTALCTALPAHLGLIVIGGEGALVIGALGAAFAATLLGDASPFALLTAMALLGALSGAGWLGMVGALRSLRGVNETISSLLLNYVAISVFKQLVEGPLRDPASLNKPSTVPIGDANMLGNLPGMDVHYGLVYGLCACVLGFALMRRTVFGFSARMVGGNVRAALLSGISVHSRIVITCALAGAAGGLAGMIEVAAVHGSANASLIAGYGYAGILVAFLARQNPLAVIPIALLLGGINASGGLLQRSFELPDATVNVLQGILFVVILGSETLYGRWFKPAASPAPALPKIEPVLGEVA